jgi:PA14 domain
MCHYLSFARQLRLILVAFVLMWAMPTFGANAQPISPWLSLHPTDNILYLHHLRKQLADEPTNQEALGLAIMAYVNLCLTGEADSDGVAGPWLSYAQGLAEQRKALRQGKTWASLDDAAPELWLLLIQGNRVAVAQALNAWPTATSHRELRVVATGDWRIFKDQPPTTLHERYIAVQIGFEMGARQLVSSLTTIERTHNPAISALMQTRANLGYYTTDELIREAITFTAWLLASSELKDEEALPLLNRFAEVLHIDLTSAGNRRSRWQQVMAACNDLEFNFTNASTDAGRVKAAEPLAKALAMSYVICDKLAQRPWLSELKRPFDFYTIGDLATWNRCRLMEASAWCSARFRRYDYALRDQHIFSVFETIAPHSFFSARARIGYQVEVESWSDKNIKPIYWTAYAQLLEAEFDRPHGHSLFELGYSIARLSRRRSDLATPILLHLRDRWAQPFPRQCFVDLHEAAEFCGQTPLFLSDLQRLAEQAPMDPPLREALAEWRPDYRLFDPTKRKAVNSWTDTTIDYAKLPTPAMRLGQGFSIIWNGKIKIDQPGDYTFAFETEDAAHLVIGDMAVSKPALRGHSTIALPTTMAAGTYDLNFEYEHLRGRGTKAVCRLLWSTPTTTELVPVPAHVLLSTDGKKPGLQASGYNFSRATEARRLYSQAECTQALAEPWNLALLHAIGKSFHIFSRYEEAIPFFKAEIENLGESFNNSASAYLHQCYLRQKSPQFDLALNIIKQYPRLWVDSPGDEEIRLFHAFIGANRLEDLQTALGENAKNDDLWPYAEALMALEQMDINQYLSITSKLLSPNSDGYNALNNSGYGVLIQHNWCFARLNDQSVDWDHFRKSALAKRKNPSPWIDLAIDWLSGDISWDDALVRSADVQDGDQLLYVRCWVDLTTGQHEDAKRGFTSLINKHPTWYEADVAKAMLRWYAKQTPESLAQLPLAKPVVPKPGVKAPPKPGANDF